MYSCSSCVAASSRLFEPMECMYRAVASATPAKAAKAGMSRANRRHCSAGDGHCFSCFCSCCLCCLCSYKHRHLRRKNNIRTSKSISKLRITLASLVLDSFSSCCRCFRLFLELPVRTKGSQQFLGSFRFCFRFRFWSSCFRFCSNSSSAAANAKQKVDHHRELINVTRDAFACGCYELNLKLI